MSALPLGSIVKHRYMGDELFKVDAIYPNPNWVDVVDKDGVRHQVMTDLLTEVEGPAPHFCSSTLYRGLNEEFYHCLGCGKRFD